MAEANPAVAGLLDALGGEPPSPELAGMVAMPPPPFVPQVFDEPAPRGRSPAYTAPDKPMNKTEQKEVLNDARSSNTPTAGYKKFGELAKLVDTNARVRVMKRLPNGQLSHISDYAKRDIESLGDVVAFLNMWIKPHRGGGTYEVSLVDPKGVEYHAGTYNLDGVDIDPNKGPASINGGSAFGENATLLLMRDMLNRPQPLPPDPIEQMQKAQKLMDSFAPKTPQSNNDSLFALMMESQRQSSAQMIALLTSKPTGPDPQMMALLDRMDRRMEKLEAAPPPPPPPPPPMMAQGPTYSIPELMTAGATLLASLVPLFRGEPGIKPMELVAMMQGAQTQTQTMMATLMGDRLTAKDMLSLQPGTPTLVDQMQQLAAVKEFATQLSPPAAGPQGTTFWDAVVTLVGNPMVAEGLGARIAKSGDGQAPDPKRVQVQDHGRPQNRPDPQIEAAAAPAEPAPPPLPANFAELCKAIDDAQDDSARAEAVFEAVKSLQPFPQWRPFCEGLLVALAQSDQPRAVAGLGKWLSILAEQKLLSSAGADRALSTFDRNFTIIRQYALDKYVPLRAIAQPPYAPLGAAPAAAVPVAEAKPVVGAAPEENGHEEATGPAPVDVVLPDEYEQG